MRVGLWELLLVRLVAGVVVLIVRALDLLFAGALWVVTTLLGVILRPVLREVAYAVGYALGRARGRRQLPGGGAWVP